ncbi:polar amino acid transport system permease protein [Burkholderia sp. GAS332]|nr:polar amino acid transport system permease protein [Burkholderia sp. GAS332]
MNGIIKRSLFAGVVVASAVALGTSVLAAETFGTSGNVPGAPEHWIWDFFSYSTSSFLWDGAVIAVEITAISMTIGLAAGLVLALMRLSDIFLVRTFARFYTWFVRGTPLLLQLVFIFDALPFAGLRFSSFITAVIGFSLNQAAFSAEIIRGGILSVNKEQSTAAGALGMGPLLTLRRIILPQAMRAILPGVGNDAISMVKLTSIASIIFLNELTFRAQQLVGQNFKFFTVFAGAAVIYLFLTSVISVIQSLLERKFDLERERRPVGETWQRLTGVQLRLVRGKSKGLPQNGGLVSVSEDHAYATDVFQTLVSGINSIAEQGDPFVVCQNVQKAYGSRTVLRGIDLTIFRGEVVVLLGPSGSGKSTFLRTVNHLEPLSSGSITVDGRYVGYEKDQNGDIRPTGHLARARADARIGMVFQHFNLFSHLTAVENVMEAPIRVFGMPVSKARTLAMQLLSEVGLMQHADHLPHRLSGGQQQRVAIARALAISPTLMLFDEPTSALDPELVGEVLGVMRKLADAGMTMIVVTHEVRFAREVADRVVFMDEGQIIEQGPPSQVIDAPTHERTRRFLNMVERSEETQLEDESTLSGKYAKV